MSATVAYPSEVRIERAKGPSRRACLTLQEARVLIEWWRQHYHTVRPHRALSYRPSAPESRAVPTVRSPPLLALVSGPGLN